MRDLATESILGSIGLPSSFYWPVEANELKEMISGLHILVGGNGRTVTKMVHRSRDWNESLAKELKDREFAKEFILSSLDEDLDLQTVLGKVIRAYGVKEFAKKIRMASPNVLRAIDRRHNPTQATLNRLLKPFGLRLTVTDIKGSGRRAG